MNLGNRLFNSLRVRKSGAIEEHDGEAPAALFLPCPFCQGKSILIRKKKSDKEVSYQAKCTACGAAGPPGANPSEAKEFWNERITGTDSAAP
jgi:Lar family restriction alleviation protein